MINIEEAKNRGKQSNSHHPISENVGHISITSQSSFHAYYISFKILGSQESIASNGARFGFETKKLWPFEDERAKPKREFFYFAAAPPFRRVFCSCETTLWHTSATSQRRTPVSQLRKWCQNSPCGENARLLRKGTMTLGVLFKRYKFLFSYSKRSFELQKGTKRS